MLQYQVKHYLLDENTQLLIDIQTGQQHKIGQHDFLILLTLCQNAGKVLTKNHLLEAGWPNRIVSESSLTQSIRTIRNLLDDNGKQQNYLKTLVKVGYCLSAEIVQQTECPSESADTEESSELSVISNEAANNALSESAEASFNLPITEITTNLNPSKKNIIESIT